jgi:hypothetical protein
LTVVSEVRTVHLQASIHDVNHGFQSRRQRCLLVPVMAGRKLTFMSVDWKFAQHLRDGNAAI